MVDKGVQHPNARTPKPKAFCAYCGSEGQLGRDHIPPKSLFPESLRKNLITVPSCCDCNVGASSDDEYFKLKVLLRHDVGECYSAKLVLPSLYRSIQKPNKIGYRKALFRSISNVAIQSAGGIFLGSTPGYDVDLNRISRVIERITRGLHFYEHGEQLPDQLDVTAACLDGALNVDQADAALFRGIVRDVMRGEKRPVGGGVFSYWHKKYDDEVSATAWVYQFYECLDFLAIVSPADA